MHEQDEPPAPARPGHCTAPSSPQGGPSGPRVVRGEERVCDEVRGEMGALTPLIPAAVFCCV